MASQLNAARQIAMVMPSHHDGDDVRIYILLRQ